MQRQGIEYSEIFKIQVVLLRRLLSLQYRLLGKVDVLVKGPSVNYGMKKCRSSAAPHS